MTRQKKPPARSPGRTASRWTRARSDTFLATLAATSNVSEAARAAGMTASSAYDRKRRDAGFAEAWGRALDTGFAELEMLLLRQALTGSERTETVVDGASGAVKQIKTVRSFPLAVAMRLLVAHRDEVERYRRGGARSGEADTGDVAARVEREIARVRARLIHIDAGEGDDRGDADGDA